MINWIATAGSSGQQASTMSMLATVGSLMAGVFGMGIFQFFLELRKNNRAALKEDRDIAQPYIQALLDDRDEQISSLRAEVEELEKQLGVLRKECGQLKLEYAVTCRDLRAARNQLMAISRQYGDRISINMSIPPDPAQRKSDRP